MVFIDFGTAAKARVAIECFLSMIGISRSLFYWDNKSADSFRDYEFTISYSSFVYGLGFTWAYKRHSCARCIGQVKTIVS